MKKEKVFCRDCKHLGDKMYFTSSDLISQTNIMSCLPSAPMKIMYMHGVEIIQRYCNCPDAPHVEEYDTFMKHVKNHFTPVCHELNKDNNCEYFKKKSE